MITQKYLINQQTQKNILLSREKDLYVIFYDFPDQSPSFILPHIGHNLTEQFVNTSSMLYDRRRMHEKPNRTVHNTNEGNN